MQRLRWKRFVVRGSQQVQCGTGQSLDDLRVMPKGFREFGQKSMSEFADACRQAGLEDMFFMALKKKIPNRKDEPTSSTNRSSSTTHGKNKKGKKTKMY